MNGSTVAAHLGNTVQKMIPELYAKIELLLQRALTGEAISGIEVERPMRGGKENRWILVSYQPAFDEADEVIGISISVMDITEHKRAKDELHESEFIQRQLVELNRLEPWMMDPEGNNLQLSSKWVRALPGSKGKIRNLGWLEAVHVDDLASTIRKMKRALSTGERIDMEYRVQNTQGEWRWMRSRGLPRFGPNGKITRWYGSVEDIHERKSVEAEARKTEVAMRALLKAVPVAIIIDEGKKRIIPGAEVFPVESQEEVHMLSARGHLPEVRASDHPLSPVKIQNHIFQVPARPSKPDSGRKKKKTIAVGLKIVDDVDHAHGELKRLVTMLEEFAQQRAER
jgi:PAS domain S-box-containing protein